MATNSKKKESEAPTTSTALAVVKAQDLLPESVVFDDLIENLKEMDEIEFPRIRFRQGKFYFSDDPSDKGVEEFEGVLLYYGRQNTYWDGTYDPNNVTPPECFSVDGENGSKARDSEGRFGNCKDCTLNQFGSGVGKGKACRNQVKLYVQVMGTTVPATLFLAPTSISNFTQNFIMNKVTQKGLNYFKIVTRFKAFQKERETYFRINFEVAGNFPTDDAAQVKKLRDFWMEAIRRDRARLDSSAIGADDEHAPKTNKPAATSASDKNVRTVTPRQQPAPSTATKSAVKEPEDDNKSVSTVAEDDEPPF